MQRDFFGRREFSFTIEDDIYIRYQSFRDCNELTTAIQKRQPHKIDIGAVFTAPPKEHNTVDPTAFKTVERELVFDIDMTDYDDIRRCCSGANICHRCWPYMTMAIKVIHQALREDFGFQNILWIYSGRRGVHCWVCDEHARSLTNDARTAVVEYLSYQPESAESTSAPTSGRRTLSYHPMLVRAYLILDPYFERFIADGTTGQGILETRESYIKILNTLPNDYLKKWLYDSWESTPSSGAEKWRQVKDVLSLKDKKIATGAKTSVDEMRRWQYELVFTHCYPRLDANVSKAQNHLLKSPFCVHPKTGRVCVAIDPVAADNFDPFAVPTVRTLCEEVFL
jgi:DNA primase small subunit